jgi:hypothetical protein
MFQALVLQKLPEGWASLSVSVSFLGGIQLMALGVLGEYIGRTFITQNKRPQFTVKETCVSRRVADQEEAAAFRTIR